ncbi:hypothetical protein Dester_0281 [Desulfurobacterium thermolithotrophum DSM 11699]|uniref:Uncharacterized protein n=1 Tax=Desulfurobacterium thermolithotrophum (strain DSM 11699 / BSA) TaxID=868864 RepID=F0S1T2_DESTD|nr:hypothetical protein [Desulfurobacterium thermolithotrophum]ADY72937.1 hypothetical protein Dester_0281 [Desulfurobacterium thermolithotrophum DSM 11699]
MIKKKRKEIIFSSILIIAVFIFRIFPSEIPYLDRKGDEYFEVATKKAVAAYATTRVLNAVVSVAKETEIEVAPLGLGMTVHLGQFLDPVDDATERLSTILTASIAALGLMKITKELLEIYTFKLISYLLFFLLPGLWIKSLRNFSRTILNIVTLLFAVRLALPICGIVNDFLYKDYFEPEINRALSVFGSVDEYEQKFSPQNISLDSIEFNDSGNYQSQEERSFWNSVKDFNPLSKLNSIKEEIFSIWNSTKEKAQEFKEFLIYLWQHKGEFVEAIGELIVLEVSMIVIQVIALPFAVIWMLTRLINVLFEKRLTLEDLVEVLDRVKLKEESN